MTPLPPSTTYCLLWVPAPTTSRAAASTSHLHLGPCSLQEDWGQKLNSNSPSPVPVGLMFPFGGMHHKATKLKKYQTLPLATPKRLTQQKSSQSTKPACTLRGGRLCSLCRIRQVKLPRKLGAVICEDVRHGTGSNPTPR